MEFLFEINNLIVFIILILLESLLIYEGLGLY